MFISRLKLTSFPLLVICLSACNWMNPVSEKAEIYNGIKNHPRLLLDEGYIEKYRNHELTRDFILKKADELVAKSHTNDFFLYPDPEDKYYHELNFQNSGDDLYTLAFAAAVTNNSVYINACEKAIVNISRWPSWGGKDGNVENRDHALQYMLRGAAYTYDWLFSILSPYSKRLLKRKMATEAEKMFQASSSRWNERWGNWWSSSYQQNHWSTNNSSLGLVALALLNEDERAVKWLDQATKQLGIKKSILEGINDGTWHEGLQYQSADLLYMIPFWHSYKVNLGKSIAPEGSYLSEFVIWRIYNYIPGQLQGLLEFADYAPSARGAMGWHPNIVFQYLATTEKDERATWIKEAREKATQDSLGWFRSPDEAAYLIYEVLYSIPEVLSGKSPKDLPLDKVFPDQNTVIFRTGWDSDDLVFGVRYSEYLGNYLSEWSLDSGMNLDPDHEHRDAGSFSLYLGSSNLSSEVSGKDNSRSTNLHNSLIISGAGIEHGGQYRTEWGSHHKGSEPRLLKTFSSPLLSYNQGDLTNRYSQELGGHNPPGEKHTSKILRSFALLKSSDESRCDYILSYDLVIPGHDRSFNVAWNMYLPPGKKAHQLEKISLDSYYINAERDKRLNFMKLSPNNATMISGSPVNDINIPFETGNSSLVSDYISWETKLDNVVLFLVVLIPEQKGEIRPELKIVAKTRNSILLEELSPNSRLMVLNPMGEYVTIGDIITDGEFIELKKHNSQYNLSIWINTSYVRVGDKILFNEDIESDGYK